MFKEIILEKQNKLLFSENLHKIQCHHGQNLVFSLNFRDLSLKFQLNFSKRMLLNLTFIKNQLNICQLVNKYDKMKNHSGFIIIFLYFLIPKHIKFLFKLKNLYINQFC